MDKASDYESGDSRFESWQGRNVLYFYKWTAYTTYHIFTLFPVTKTRFVFCPRHKICYAGRCKHESLYAFPFVTRSRVSVKHFSTSISSLLGISYFWSTNIIAYGSHKQSSRNLLIFTSAWHERINCIVFANYMLLISYIIITLLVALWPNG